MVALVGLGLAAAGIATVFWNARGTPPGSATGQDAGAAPWDPRQADAQLGPLKQGFEQVTVDGQNADGLIKAVQRMVERYPRYAPGRTLLGQIWLYMGQLDQAYGQFKLSLDLDGQQPEVHLLSGTIAYKLGRIDQATGHYSMAVGMEPANARYRLHLAQAYLRQHKSDQARALLLETLQIDSSLHEAYAALADLYAQQNRLTLALPQIQKAIDQTPVSQRAKQVFYIRRKAHLLRRDNRPQEALLTLQGLQGAEKTDPGVLEEMATCWFLLGKPNDAAAVFEDAAAADPTRWTLLAGAARWRIKAGDRSAALRHLALLRRLNPRAAMISQLEAQAELAVPE